MKAYLRPLAISTFAAFGALGCATLSGLLSNTSNFTGSVPIETGTGGVETVIVVASDLDQAPIAKNGVALLASMIRILQDQYGSRLIWVDTGQIARSPSLASTLSTLGLRATLSDPSSQAEPVITSAGRIRVGLIFLRGLDQLSSTAAKTLAAEQSEKARAQGAQIVVLLTDSGVECAAIPVSSPYRIHKPTDLHSGCPVMDSHASARLVALQGVAEIPAPNNIDLIVTGQSETGNWKSGAQIRWISGNTPMMRPQSRGKGLTVAYLYNDEKRRSLLLDRTRLEGAIPVCEKISEQAAHCLPGNRGPWAKMRLRGRPVTVASEIKQALKAELELEEKRLKTEESEIIGQIPTIASLQQKLDLLADVLRQEAEADVAYVHSGALATGDLPAGKISLATLRSIFEDGSQIGVVQVGGRELKLLTRALYNGAQEFPGISGGRIRLIDRPYEAASSDLDANNKIDYWEIDRLLSIQVDGKDPREGKKYRVALPWELIEGRESMVWVGPHLGLQQKAIKLPYTLGEVFSRALKRSEFTVDADPRVKLERAVKKSTKRRSMKRKTRK